MTRDQAIRHALWELKRAIPEIAGHEKLVTERLNTLFDQGKSSAILGAIGAQQCESCVNCGNHLTDQNRRDLYGDGGVLVCSEKCAVGQKAWDAERFSGTGRD